MSESTPPKIALIDDHPLLRAGIKDYLETTAKMSVVAEFSSAEQFREAILDYQFDVLVLDISMPGEDGFSIVDWLSKHHKNIPVIIYSMHNLKRYFEYFKTTHVKGYVLKSSNMQELVNAIYKAKANENYYDPKINTAEVSYNYEENQVQFTAEEQKVLYLLSKNLSNQTIAAQMGVSSQDLMKTRKGLLFKANVKNTNQLLDFARHKKLIDSDKPMQTNDP